MRDVFGDWPTLRQWALMLGAMLMVALYARSGTLWVAIAAHALNNATTGAVGAVIEARSSLGWAIIAAQLLAVPWLAWFIYSSLRTLSSRQQREDRRRQPMSEVSKAQPSSAMPLRDGS